MEVSTPAARNYLGLRPVQERIVRKSGGALGGKVIMEAKQSGWGISLGASKVRSGAVRQTVWHDSAGTCWLLQITCEAFTTFSITARGRCLGRELPLRSGFLIPKKMINNEAMNIVVVKKVLFTRFSLEVKQLLVNGI